MISTGAFAAGLLMLAAVGGAAALAGQTAVRRWAPRLPRLEAALAWALCATAALIAIHAVPLVLGIMSRGTVLVAAGVMAAAAVALRRPAPVRDRAESGRGGAVRWLGAAAALLAAGAALAYLRTQAGQPVLSADTLNFQLPQVARWLESGSLWQLDQFFPLYSNATYPHHGNVLLLAVVLPFDATFLARLVPVPFAVLACAGIYAASREIGARHGWALLAAALFASIPVFSKTALDGANTDTPMLAFTALGVLFGLRHHRTEERSDLALAALALGLALGTKWYALTTIVPLLAVWTVARLISGVRPARVARQLIGVSAGILAAGGLWLVRNWAEAGNPLFPQPLLGLFDAPRDVIREQAGFTLAHYLFDGDVWSTYLLPQFDDFFAAPGYVLAAAPLVALVLARRRRDGRAAAVSVAALALLAAYFVAPYGAFGAEGRPVLAFASTRYGMPALILGAVALGWAGSALAARAGRGAAAAALVAATALQGIATQYDLPWAQIVVAALAVWLAVAVTRRAPRFAVAAGLLLALAGAFAVRDRAADRGYGDPVLAAVESQEGKRVALAGVWSVDGVSPVLPAFGPRLRNEVFYAGPFRQHLLRQETDRDAFVRSLRGADLLIVGRGAPPSGPAPEEAWAREAGYEVVTDSERLALLRRS